MPALYRTRSWMTSSTDSSPWYILWKAVLASSSTSCGKASITPASEMTVASSGCACTATAWTSFSCCNVSVGTSPAFAARTLRKIARVSTEMLGRT